MKASLFESAPSFRIVCANLWCLFLVLIFAYINILSLVTLIVVFDLLPLLQDKQNHRNYVF